MAFLDPSSRPNKTVAPGVTLKTFWQTQMMPAIVTIEPNAVVPSHAHPAEQAGVVISGTITFTIGDETRTLAAGDSYLIAGDVPHEAVAGDGPVQLFEVFSPIRDELK